jgi:2-oxoglutarate dehydrogenase E2 component (dihydrolipoamide succinyltransferase)
MTTEVIMPQLGESVVEGTVIKWLIGEADSVEEFEPLVEINTDKVDTEVPSPATGTILKLLVAEGETVRAGTLLAVIGEPGEEVPEAPKVLPENGDTAPPADREGGEAKAPSLTEREVQGAPAAPSSASPSRAQGADLGFISPVVARIAAEQKVDLSQVSGSGSGGRITKKDVLAYVEAGQPVAPWEEPASGELFRPTEEIFGKKSPAPTAAAGTGLQAGTVVPLDVVRTRIAEHMVRSKHTSPHVTTLMEADMGRVVAHRKAHKESFQREGANLTFTAYFVAASVEALKEYPMVNSSWSDEGIVLHKSANVGVAVSLGEEGLIVPVVKNAEQLSLLAIAKAVNDLGERARNHKLVPDEVQGGTFTITNHGVSGSLLATPIINQPECAILGVGVLQKRPVVIEGMSPSGEPEDSLAIRPMVYLTLTFDHRIIDGAMGDHFLGIVVQRLQSWV